MPRPTWVTAEGGVATVLVLRDAHAAQAGVEYEVSCPNPQLARHLSEKVSVGDRLVVVGSLRLDAVPGPLEDQLSAARITLIADTIGHDLGSTPENPMHGAES